MSNKHIDVEPKINVRELDPGDIDPKAVVVRYTSKFSSTPTIIGNGDEALTGDEEKALHRTLLRQYIHDGSIAVKLSNHDVLAKTNATAGAFGTTNHLLLLTVYEGQDTIPTTLKELNYESAFTKSQSPGSTNRGNNATLIFEEWSRFKRSSLPAGRKNLPHQRWFRIHAVQANKDLLQHDQKNAIFGNKCIRFYLIPMQMVCSKQTLRKALTLHKNTNPDIPTPSLTYGQFRNLGGQLKPDTGHKLFKARQTLVEPEHAHSFPGLRLTMNPKFRIHLDITTIVQL